MDKIINPVSYKKMAESYAKPAYKLKEGVGAGYQLTFIDIKLTNVKVGKTEKDGDGFDVAKFTADIVPGEYGWYADHPYWTAASEGNPEPYNFDSSDNPFASKAVITGGKVEGTCDDGGTAWRSEGSPWSEKDFIDEIESETFIIQDSYSGGWVHSPMTDTLEWEVEVRPGYERYIDETPSERGNLAVIEKISFNFDPDWVMDYEEALDYAENPDREDWYEEDEWDDEEDEDLEESKKSGKSRLNEGFGWGHENLPHPEDDPDVDAFAYPEKGDTVKIYRTDVSSVGEMVPAKVYYDRFNACGQLGKVKDVYYHGGVPRDYLVEVLTGESKGCELRLPQESVHLYVGGKDTFDESKMKEYTVKDWFDENGYVQARDKADPFDRYYAIQITKVNPDYRKYFHHTANVGDLWAGSAFTFVDEIGDAELYETPKEAEEALKEVNTTMDRLAKFKNFDGRPYELEIVGGYKNVVLDESKLKEDALTSQVRQSVLDVQAAKKQVDEDVAILDKKVDKVSNDLVRVATNRPMQESGVSHIIKYITVDFPISNKVETHKIHFR